MRSANELIGLLDNQVMFKEDRTKLQIDAAAAQADWDSLLEGIPLSAASVDWRFDHPPSTTILTALSPLETKDAEDVTGIAAPRYRQGNTNGTDPDNRFEYGDDGWDDTFNNPYFIGSLPDPWGAWDGCSPVAGAAILGYWMNRGYANLNCLLPSRASFSAAC